MLPSTHPPFSIPYPSRRGNPKNARGIYDPPQTVAWTVGNAHAGTAIDATGRLTISKGETSRMLLVIATSTANPNYSDTAEVTVRALSQGAMLLILALFLVLVLIAILLLL